MPTRPSDKLRATKTVAIPVSKAFLLIRHSRIGEAARSMWRGLLIASSRRSCACFSVTIALRLAALAAALRNL